MHGRSFLKGTAWKPPWLEAGAEDGKEVKVKVTVGNDAHIGRHEFRVVTARGVTNKIALDVLAGPVLEEAAVTGPLAQFPVTISGRLAQPGETDAYWIEIEAGATLTFEAVSRAAGFDPAVALYEPSGSWFDTQRLNRIAFNDEPLYFPGLSTNARLVHHFPRGGKYCVKVHGFNGEGGPDRAYELRITPGVTAAPSLHPELNADVRRAAIHARARPELAEGPARGAVERPERNRRPGDVSRRCRKEAPRFR